MANPPLDRIFIRDLQARCIIGINPDERREKQDVIVNITLHADLSAAGKSDDIQDTADYKNIKKEVLALVESSEFLLIERLAEQIANIALKPDLVERAVVSIDKPGALRFARSVAVEVTRSKTR